MDSQTSAALWALAGAALVVVLTRLQRRVWFRGYWGFGELLTGFEYSDRPGALAVIAKLGIGLAVGAVASFGVTQSEPWVGALAAGFGALALVWPIFASDEAIGQYVQDKAFELRLIYVLFVATYAALGAVGGAVMAALKVAASSQGAGDFLASLGTNVVSNALWALIVLVLSAIYTNRANRRTHEIREDALRTYLGPPASLEMPPESDDASLPSD